MHKAEVLVVTRYPDADMAALEQDYTLHILADAKDPDALLAEIAPRIRALATNGEAGASAKLIDALPHLEIIVSYGVGVDAIDLERAAQRNIRVTYTPDVLTDDVADLGIALMLSVARDIPQNDAIVRAGEWGHAQIPLATRVFGKRLGILGLGRVGRAVAKRAAGFDMAISYHDRNRFDDSPYTFHETAVELARDSDFLIICAAADRSNRASIGRDVLDALGPDSFLINIARGSIIDEPVLLNYLTERRIRGAALDVFWSEPAIDTRFFALQNVVLQPHRASGTVETRAAMAQLVRNNLAAFFAGEPLITEYTVHKTRT